MKKDNHSILLFSTAIFSLLIASGIFFYSIEVSNNPVVKEKIRNSDFKYLYRSYIFPRPNIENVPYYGSKNASIMFIAYLSIGSDASRHFMKDVFPLIKVNYTDKEKIRYYHKTYLTLEDINVRNDNFKYAVALSCVNKLKKEAYYPFYFDLFSINSTDNLYLTAEKYKISRNQFTSCTSNPDMDLLYEDAFEIQNFGMIGINQRFYIGLTAVDSTALDGVPDYQKFETTLREYEIRIGD
jgi:hypothetical protein